MIERLSMRTVIAHHSNREGPFEAASLLLTWHDFGSASGKCINQWLKLLLIVYLGHITVIDFTSIRESGLDVLLLKLVAVHVCLIVV